MVTFLDYYKNRYKIGIKDTSQPLLISALTSRDRRAGQEHGVLLVPELCLMTGLTDSHRANLNLMKVRKYKSGEFKMSHQVPANRRSFCPS